jgi:hypothetical protein
MEGSVGSVRKTMGSCRVIGDGGGQMRRMSHGKWRRTDEEDESWEMEEDR